MKLHRALSIFHINRELRFLLDYLPILFHIITYWAPFRFLDFGMNLFVGINHQIFKLGTCRIPVINHQVIGWQIVWLVIVPNFILLQRVLILFLLLLLVRVVFVLPKVIMGVHHLLIYHVLIKIRALEQKGQHYLTRPLVLFPLIFVRICR